MFFMICFRPGLLNPAVAAAKGKDTVMEIVGETCVVLDFGVLLFVRLLFLQAVKNLIVIDCWVNSVCEWNVLKHMTYYDCSI